MTAGYLAELRRLILVWEFTESLFESGDDARKFYRVAIDNATQHIIEAHKEHPHGPPDETR